MDFTVIKIIGTPKKIAAQYVTAISVSVKVEFSIFFFYKDYLKRKSILNMI